MTAKTWKPQRNEKGYYIGEAHHNAKFTDAEVELILNLREVEKWTYERIAQKMECAKSTIQWICTYRNRAQTPDVSPCASGKK